MGLDLSSAAAVVMNTPESAAAARAHLRQLDPARVHAIPNGYDGADFEDEVEPTDDGVFRIAHAGLLHTGLGRDHRRSAGLRRVLGGSLGDVDILPRSHVYLLEAVDRLLEETPALRGRLRVELAGALTEDDRALAADDPCGRPRLPARIATPSACCGARTCCSCRCTTSSRRLPHAPIVPGKTYEYLASRDRFSRPCRPATPATCSRLSGQRVRVLRPADVGATAPVIR